MNNRAYMIRPMMFLMLGMVAQCLAGRMGVLLVICTIVINIFCEWLDIQVAKADAEERAKLENK